MNQAISPPEVNTLDTWNAKNAPTDLTRLDPSVRVGEKALISCERVEIGRNVRIGDNVRIRARILQLGDDVRIDRDVRIDAHEVRIGWGSHVQHCCCLAGAGGNAGRLIHIGEQSLVAHDTKLLVPIAIIGDYTDIHNHCLLYGRKSLVVGHNVWVGQNCVLNAEAPLTLGNNVGIGAYSSVYTHGYFGDLLEGSQVFKLEPTTIGDDVWILGAYNIISPGVKLGEKSLVLAGSTVTRDVAPNHTVGGSPARDLTDRMVPYIKTSADEKYERIQQFVREFIDEKHSQNARALDDGFLVAEGANAFRILFTPVLDLGESFPEDRPLLVFTKRCSLPEIPEGVTVFDLSQRHYIRARTRPERDILRFLKTYRARFVPQDNPRVLLPRDLAI